jgi:4a-hydroxytetrahydrobiopterin dehydratase
MIPMTPEKPAPLSDAEISAALTGLPGWERDGDTLKKTYKLERYMAGLAFASAVGTIAEGLDHHPDIIIGWRKVTVIYYTHAAGNKITRKDVDAALAIEALPYKPRA